MMKIILETGEHKEIDFQAVPGAQSRDLKVIRDGVPTWLRLIGPVMADWIRYSWFLIFSWIRCAIFIIDLASTDSLEHARRHLPRAMKLAARAGYANPIYLLGVAMEGKPVVIPRDALESLVREEQLAGYSYCTQMTKATMTPVLETVAKLALEQELHPAVPKPDKLPEPVVISAKDVHSMALKMDLYSLECITVTDVFMQFQYNGKDQMNVAYFDGDGVPLSFTINGKAPPLPFSLIPGDAAEIVNDLCSGQLPRFDHLTVFAREMGHETEDASPSIFLELVIAAPGSKKTMGPKGRIVPACKVCDVMLHVLYSHNETGEKNCPYCSHPLEVVWRVASIWELEAMLDPASLRAMEEGKWQGTFPVSYNGKMRAVTATGNDIYWFLVHYSSKLSKGLGPYKLKIWIPASSTQDITDLRWKGAISIYAKRELMDEKGQMLPAIEIFPRDSISPKKSFHEKLNDTAAASAIDVRVKVLEDEKARMKEKVEKEKAKQLALKAKAVEAKERKEKEKKALKEEMVDMATVLRNSSSFDTRKRLTNAFIKFCDTKTRFDQSSGSTAYFIVSLADAGGKEISLAATLPGHLEDVKQVSRIYFNSKALGMLMGEIQGHKENQFLDVKFFVLESSVQYKANEPIHYYLKPILNEPGKKTRVGKESRDVPACKSCDAMLLHYSFEWKVQRDDIPTYESDGTFKAGPVSSKMCPYCGKPLEVIGREPRVVPVLLDFKATGCSILGSNNQIGATYNGLPVNLTVKVKGMFNFLQNYQAQFKNGVMGPLDIYMEWHTDRANAREIQFGELPAMITWRSVVLYPEDLIAF
nr:hypothetical protein [Candidatus Sigynarchaeota archaeon]